MELNTPKISPISLVGGVIYVNWQGKVHKTYFDPSLFKLSSEDFLHFIIGQVNYEILKFGEPEVYLTCKEASDKLKVHAQTLRRWADNGSIKCTKTVGSHRRFLLSDIHKMMENK